MPEKKLRLDSLRSSSEKEGSLPRSNTLRTSVPLLTGFGRRHQKEERESRWEVQGKTATGTTQGPLIPNTSHER